MEQIDRTRGHAINLGSGETFRVGDLMEDICDAVGGGLHPEVVEKGDSFKEIEKQWLDLTKLRSFVPDFEYVTMSDGLRMTVDWYKEFNKFREV
jgi:nucleoside-diphosphate-sugar epimerase